MALPTALLVKGLAGLGIVAAGTTGIVLFLNKNSNREINEKIKALGISGCELGNGETSRTCTLDKANLEKVKFEKTGGTFDSAANASLTITKVTGVEAEGFKDDLKFTFRNSTTTDIILGSSSDTITLKKDVGYDFKIKDGTKLEKAWTIKSLGDKVGLSCSGDDATSCTLTTGKINVWKDKSNYILEATVATGSSSNMTVTKDTANYNQGFKLTVSSDTNLTQNTEDKKVGTVEKLTKDNTTYEIDLRNDKGTKKWFLVEKSTTTPS